MGEFDEPEDESTALEGDFVGTAPLPIETKAPEVASTGLQEPLMGKIQKPTDLEEETIPQIQQPFESRDPPPI